MSRPQFTLRALLVAMLVVGAFFGGAAWQKRRMGGDLKRFEKELRQALEEENRRQPALIEDDTIIIDQVTPRRITPLD